MAGGTPTLTVGSNSATSTFSGVLQNTTGLLTLTKIGSGTLTLANANTFSGMTTLNAGTLAVSNSLALQNSTVTGNFGSLAFVGPTAVTVGGLAGAANVNLQNSASQAVALTVGNNNASTFYAGVLSGSGGLTKVGSGTLAIGGSNTYSGPTTVMNGTLQVLGWSPYSPAAQYTFNGNTNDSSGNANNGTAVGSPIYTAGKFGGQAITFNGSSQYVTVPYSSSLGLNTFTVSFWENLPTLTQKSSATYFGGIGTHTLDIQFAPNGYVHGDIGNGSVWLTTTANTTANPITANTWNMITETVSSSGYSIYVNGALSGSGALGGTPLMMSSGQTLTIGTQPGNFYLNGSMDDVNIFNGVLTQAQINSLYVGQAGQTLPVASPASIANVGTLDLNGMSQTVASLADVSGAGGTVTSSATGAVTLTLAPTTTTSFSGVISNGSGTLGLIVNGAGMQVLAGSNTYSGGTTVTTGTLQFANTAALPSSGTTTVNGGMLAVNAGGSNEFTNATSGPGSIGNVLSATVWNPNSVFGIDTTNASARLDLLRQYRRHPGPDQARRRCADPDQHRQLLPGGVDRQQRHAQRRLLGLQQLRHDYHRRQRARHAAVYRTEYRQQSADHPGQCRHDRRLGHALRQLEHLGLERRPQRHGHESDSHRHGHRGG